MARILVADDNSNIQKMVGLALKDQGIDVVAVGNGEAAVRKISDIKPDLVLADVFMPVRNGYEVCKYVKDDPKLRHIPVILLVGAFDPLDEQEAQRVGADGVLKKPFVPPDPLISMVKSALARAGVSIGAAAAAEKVAEDSARKAADLLAAGASAKLAAMKAELLTAAPVEQFPEEFTTPAKPFTIDAGHEPLAFGSMLDTSDVDETVVFAAKPNPAMNAERNWGNESNEGVDVEEEEESGGGWQPDGLEEAIAKVSGSPPDAPTNGLNEITDWREEAFHGSSPASDVPMPSWASGAEQARDVEAAEIPAVAVTMVNSQPEDVPASFSDTTRAAAIATGVSDNIPAPAVSGPGSDVPHASAGIADEEAFLPQIVEAPAVVPAADEPMTQESVPAVPFKLPEPSNGRYAARPSPWDLEAKKASTLASTWEAPTPVDAIPPEHTSDADLEPAHLVAESAVVAEHLETPVETFVHGEAHDDVTTLQEVSPQVGHYTSETILEDAAAPAESTPPIPMDELVARVLAKMNPELMQRVTRDILKPVIEALLKDEMNAKK